MNTYALQRIIGKTIKTIVVSEYNRAGPRDQLFLVFTDGTAYELYGDIGSASKLDLEGEESALHYVGHFKGTITRLPTHDGE